jgi:hypothetical protein
VSAPHEFLVDLALRYFVSFLYNLDGFMEPLRTGLSEGAFCVLGIVARENADPSASLGMTIFRGMKTFWSG